MDHLLFQSSKPAFLNYFYVAFILRSRRSLLNTGPSGLTSFLQTKSALNVKQTIKLAYDLQKKYEKNVNMGSYAQNLPLCLNKDQYELFQRYP